MSREYDEIVGGLTEKQNEALNLLIELRSKKKLLYKDTLEEVFYLLGSDYKVKSEEVAKGLLIAIVTIVFGFGKERDITLLSLNLIEGYTSLSLTDRRRAYVRKTLGINNDENNSQIIDPEVERGVENLRKEEKKYLSRVVKELDDRLSKFGDVYIDRIFEHANQSGFMYSLFIAGDWRAILPKLGEPGRVYRTDICTKSIDINKTEERYIDEIRQRIIDGERTINTFTVIAAPRSYIGDQYYYKYHEKHDLYLSVQLYKYDGRCNIRILIHKVADSKILRILLPCSFEELEEMVGCYKSPVFVYTYESDGEPDDEEIFNWLKNKGVVFYYSLPKE